MTSSSTHPREIMDLIFLCAGRGTRVGLECPKQFVELQGKPLLMHSLEVYRTLPFIGKKIIVYDPVDAGRIERILNEGGMTNYLLITGGTTRQESMRRGLAHASTSRVISHNAAVPFISPEMIERVLAADADCVSTSSDLKDSVVRSDAGDFHAVKRTGLKVINSPQAFRTAALRDAHAAAFLDNRQFTSDAELMLHYGHSLQLVPGPAWSFKVTDRLDLALAETVLSNPELFSPSTICPPIAR